MKSYWIVNDRQHAIVRVRARTEKEALARFALKAHASRLVMPCFRAVESNALTALVEIGLAAREFCKFAYFGEGQGITAIDVAAYRNISQADAEKMVDSFRRAYCR